MICKVIDRNRVTHYRVVGWDGNWHACDVFNEGGRPASWRRPVDCMACVALVTRLLGCPHGTGNVVRVVFDPGEGLLFLTRQCADCSP